MTKHEIITEALTLTKKDKFEVVNRILASMNDNPEKYPVFDALVRFKHVYRALKNTEYGGVKFSPSDFRGMKMLLEKLKGICPLESTDGILIGAVENFMKAVASLPNKWYFENRFTPLNLAQDFDKIYSSLNTNSYVNRTKRAFDYL